MAKFSVDGTAVMGTNVTAAAVFGGTTVKPAIYDITLSCPSTPADQQMNWTVAALDGTSAGTGSAVTPKNLDADGPAALSTAKKTFTGEPTVYASVTYLYIGVHQRAVYRWIAREGGELIGAKVANAGIGLKAAITSGTPTAQAVVHFYE